MRLHSYILSALIAAAIAAPAAGSTAFVATLDGSQNVPPLPVPGMGSARLVLNDAQTELSFNIEYSGLLSPENAAHIHNGSPRENGPIVFGLPLGSPKTGVWETPADMVTELFNDRLYMNIHTDLYIAGEIRGNIHLEILPTEPTTWARIKSLWKN